MPQSTSFWDHPVEKIEDALGLKKQIAALQAKLSSMFSDEDDKTPAKPVAVKAAPAATRGGKHTMSPEARERIAAAQRARWAKLKGASKPTPATSAKKGGKRTISPESRAKMAKAARTRWAEKRSKR